MQDPQKPNESSNCYLVVIGLIFILLCNGCTLVTAHHSCAQSVVIFKDFTNYFHPWESKSKMTVYTCDGTRICSGKSPTEYNTNQVPILLLHEMPGMTPECLVLATNLAAVGFTVHVPLMFGQPCKNQTSYNIAKAIFSPKWYLLRKNKTPPIISDLRELANEVSRIHNQKPMAVIGMCLSGTLPLALLTQTNVMFVVLSQPALPALSLTYDQRVSLAISPKDLELAKKKVARDQIEVIGLRFASDRICQAERFENLSYCFKTNFLDWTIPFSQYPPSCPKHSVLCEDYDNRECSATRKVLDDLKDHLKKRFLTEQQGSF